jgi:hypothetical protein
VKRLATLAALAAAAALAGCSYNAESSFLGYRSSISYSTPGAGPPPAPPRQAYYAPPPGPPPACYVPGHYNRWGHWVAARYRC